LININTVPTTDAVLAASTNKAGENFLACLLQDGGSCISSAMGLFSVMALSPN
jgi:hypothetical protein